MAKRKKILLVEDDAELREVLAELLQNDGYSVTEVGDGDAGQFMSFLSEFDLIISDVRMPKVDGLEMVDFIKKRLTTPVIIITGLSKEEVSEKFVSVKPDAIFQKPFSPTALMATVTSLLKK